MGHYFLLFSLPDTISLVMRRDSIPITILLKCFGAFVKSVQNWSHVNTVVEHLNRLPSKGHGTDIMRIRPWYALKSAFFFFHCVISTPGAYSIFKLDAQILHYLWWASDLLKYCLDFITAINYWGLNSCSSLGVFSFIFELNGYDSWSLTEFQILRSLLFELTCLVWFCWC